MAALRDGSWTVRLQLEDGRTLETSTDDLLLGQIDVAERASGVPWAYMDPRGSVRVAIALFAVLLIRDGMAEDKALATAQELPGGTLRGAFTWVPPEEPQPATGERSDPPRLGAYVDSWLLWGARLFGWAPDVTRRQTHGDLIRLSDAMLRNMERQDR